jgi:hypothetical protein
MEYNRVYCCFLAKWKYYLRNHSLQLERHPAPPVTIFDYVSEVGWPLIGGSNHRYAIYLSVTEILLLTRLTHSR